MHTGPLRRGRAKGQPPDGIYVQCACKLEALLLRLLFGVRCRHSSVARTAAAVEALHGAPHSVWAGERRRTGDGKECERARCERSSAADLLPAVSRPGRRQYPQVDSASCVVCWAVCLLGLPAGSWAPRKARTPQRQRRHARLHRARSPIPYWPLLPCVLGLPSMWQSGGISMAAKGSGARAVTAANRAAP